MRAGAHRGQGRRGLPRIREGLRAHSAGYQTPWRIKIPAVGPFLPEMAMLAHDTHLCVFSLLAKFLGCIDCEEHDLGLTAVGAIFSITELEQPFVLMLDHDVSRVRHDLLPISSQQHANRM